MNNELTDLTIKIEKLQALQHTQMLDLKSQFQFTMATLSPSNFIKNTIQDAIELPDLQESILDSAIGLATGFISKKLLIGATQNPVKKLLGTVFQLVVTSYTANHTSILKNVSSQLFSKIFSGKKNTP
jgi:hypothetical protein